MSKRQSILSESTPDLRRSQYHSLSNGIDHHIDNLPDEDLHQEFNGKDKVCMKDYLAKHLVALQDNSNSSSSASEEDEGK